MSRKTAGSAVVCFGEPPAGGVSVIVAPDDAVPPCEAVTARVTAVYGRDSVTVCVVDGSMPLGLAAPKGSRAAALRVWERARRVSVGRVAEVAPGGMVAVPDQ